MPQKMEEHRKTRKSAVSGYVRMLLQVYSCIIEWAPVTMSQLSLLPLRALPYSSVGDEAYQSSSHHIRKGQKKQVKLLGLPSPKCPNPNLDFGLSLRLHLRLHLRNISWRPMVQVLEKRFRRAWTAHGAVQFSSLSPSEIWSWSQSTRTKTPRSPLPEKYLSKVLSFKLLTIVQLCAKHQSCHSMSMWGWRGVSPATNGFLAFMSSYHDLQDFKSIYFWKCQLRHTGMSFFNRLVWSSMNQSSMILWGTVSPFRLEFWHDMCSVICNLLFFRKMKRITTLEGKRGVDSFTFQRLSGVNQDVHKALLRTDFVYDLWVYCTFSIREWHPNRNWHECTTLTTHSHGLWRNLNEVDSSQKKTKHLVPRLSYTAVNQGACHASFKHININALVSTCFNHINITLVRPYVTYVLHASVRQRSYSKSPPKVPWALLRKHTEVIVCVPSKAYRS